jgi:hypothetical protein
MGRYENASGAVEAGDAVNFSLPETFRERARSNEPSSTLDDKEGDDNGGISGVADSGDGRSASINVSLSLRSSVTYLRRYRRQFKADR